MPFLTARENVELGARAARPAGADDALRRRWPRSGWGSSPSGASTRLSAGERQRVAIARALAPRPALLLADEPTARLDQANALAVARLLARLAQETGAAVVCATHDAAVIAEADEELALRRDQAATGASSAARATHVVAQRGRAFLGDLDRAGADGDAVGELGRGAGVLGRRDAEARVERHVGEARARSTRPASAGERSSRAPVVPATVTR